MADMEKNYYDLIIINLYYIQAKYCEKNSNTECGTFGVVVTRLNGKKHRDTNKNWDNGNRVIQSTIMAGSREKNEMRIGSQTFSIIVSIHGLLSDFVRY